MHRIQCLLQQSRTSIGYTIQLSHLKRLPKEAPPSSDRQSATEPNSKTTEKKFLPPTDRNQMPVRRYHASQCPDRIPPLPFVLCFFFLSLPLSLSLLSLSFSPPPLPLEIQEYQHPKRNQRSNPPSTSPLPTTNYHPLQNAATQINHHPQKPHRKTPQTKTKLPTTHKAFFYLQRIPVKPTKQHSDQNPKGRKSGSMAYSQQNQKEGLQKRREAKP